MLYQDAKIDLVNDLGYNKCVLRFTFFLVFWMNICTNLDHGGVPSAINNMMDDLDLKETQMGSLGAILFIGLVFGSACATLIIDKFSLKNILFLSMLFNGLGFMVLSISKNFYVLCAARVISGFF